MFCYCSKNNYIPMLVITQPFIYLLVLLTDAPKCSHTQLTARVSAQKRPQKADFHAGLLTV